jgi:hypothetical protein
VPGGSAAILAIKVIADVADAQKGLGEVSSTADKVGGAIGSMALPALGAVTALTAMAKAAADDQAEAAKLEQTIRAAGAATAESTAQVEAAIVAGQAKAFSDSQSREALAALVTATGDVTKSTELLATAQDIARFAGVDLTTAADALAKATAGSDGALRKLIPGLEKGATATDTIAAAQKAAAGQADLYAQSTQGQLEISADAFGELGETIGTAFLPILQELTGILTQVAQFLTQNAGLVKALAVVVGVLAGGILAANIAMKAFEAIQIAVKIATTAWTAVQWLLNAALNANPIGLVVIAITALIAILALAWANSETFRNVVTAAFKTVQKVVEGVIKAIENAFAGLKNFIDGIVNGISSALRGIGDAIGNLPKLPSLPFSVAPPGAVPAPTVRGRTARSAGASQGGTSIVINTGADPEAVMRAIRRWAGNNGGNAAFVRSLDRSVQ